MKPKLLIDTDPGVDDALALMMAVNADIFDIVAITTLCGNSTVENSMRNARYILNSIGKSEVSLYQGASNPLVRPLRQAVVHGEDGLLGMNKLGSIVSDGDAVDTILKMVGWYPDEVTIIALGPLTNIATAIQRAPAVMSRVQNIIIMGGAINVVGNMSNGAEFNFFVDPEAAKIVCEFPIAKILIPLDVCNQAIVTLADLNRLRGDKNGALLRRLIEPYIENIYNETGVDGAIMYDPLAVYYAINREAFKVEEVKVSIGTREGNRGVISVKGAKSDGLSIMAATAFSSGFDFADAFVEVMDDSSL